jgi:hypothetical protein
MPPGAFVAVFAGQHAAARKQTKMRFRCNMIPVVVCVGKCDELMSELGQFRFPTVHETWVKRGKDPTIHATARPVRTEFDVTTTTSLFQVPKFG